MTKERALSKNILIKLISSTSKLIFIISKVFLRKRKMIEINEEKCRKALKLTENEFKEKQNGRSFRQGRSDWKTIWPYIKQHHEAKYGSLDGILDYSTRQCQLAIERKINRVLTGKSSVEIIEYDTEREVQPRRRPRQDNIDPNPAPSQARRSSRNSKGSTQRRSHSQTVDNLLQCALGLPKVRARENSCSYNLEITLHWPIYSKRETGVVIDLSMVILYKLSLWSFWLKLSRRPI